MRLQTESWANGGAAIAREDSGRVVFVSGALPGEVVEAAITSEQKRFARAVTGVVETSAADRVVPTCPHVGSGCGGCDLAHVSEAGQQGYAAAVVTDALQRNAGLESPVVELAAPLPQRAYRTTVRCLVETGGAAYRAAASNAAVPVDSCEVAHPLVEELIRESRFGSAAEVTLRAGAATGERMVVATPTAEGVAAPEGTQVIGMDELDAGRRAWIHEEVAGRVWRISARSFFQARPDGAARLVELVTAAVAGSPPGPLVDLYSGVGLFAGSASGGRPTKAVESSGSSAADARHNLADLGTKVVRCAVEKWKPSRAAVVVADPPRSGLQAAGVAKVVESDAQRVVLISCDVGSLGRDVGLLTRAGYGHARSTIVPMFPQTSQVEVVTVMDR